MTAQEKYLLLSTIADYINKLTWHIDNQKQYLLRGDFDPPYKWTIHPLCNTYFNIKSSFLGYSCEKCINFIFKVKDIFEIDPDDLVIEEANPGDYIIPGDFPCNFRRTWHIKLKRINFIKNADRPMLYLEAARDFWRSVQIIVKETPPEKIVLNSASKFGIQIIKIDKDIYKKYLDLYNNLPEIINSQHSLADKILKLYPNGCGQIVEGIE
jgi:hypothetical protein